MRSLTPASSRLHQQVPDAAWPRPAGAPAAGSVRQPRPGSPPASVVTVASREGGRRCREAPFLGPEQGAGGQCPVQQTPQGEVQTSGRAERPAARQCLTGRGDAMWRAFSRLDPREAALSCVQTGLTSAASRCLCARRTPVSGAWAAEVHPTVAGAEVASPKPWARTLWC